MDLMGVMSCFLWVAQGRSILSIRFGRRFRNSNCFSSVAVLSDTFEFLRKFSLAADKKH